MSENNPKTVSARDKARKAARGALLGFGRVPQAVGAKVQKKSRGKGKPRGKSRGR